MSLFHKNINEKLSQHILELEQIGVLTDDWYWNSQKVSQLKRIDEKLMRNLLVLYNSKKTDREKFLLILQKLSALHRILKIYMKKSTAGPKDKRFVMLINRFVREIENLLDDFPLRIGVIGWITQSFDVNKARILITRVFGLINQKYPKRRKEVVSKLVNIGVPALAYNEAVVRDWRTMGIAPSIAKTLPCFPVNEEIIEGNGWYEESRLFIEKLDILVRIGGLYQCYDESREAKKNNKEVFEFNLNANLRTISEIDPLLNQEDVVRERKQFPSAVERPLLRACIMLYDKNIHTISSSANIQNIGRNAVIVIDYDSLSDENKKIAEQYSAITEANLRTPFRTVAIKIPIGDENTLISEIERKSLEIARKFKPQKMTWARIYTWKQLLEMYRITPKRAREMKLTEKSFGLYYDPETKLFYQNKEQCEKVKKSRNLK